MSFRRLLGRLESAGPLLLARLHLALPLAGVIIALHACAPILAPVFYRAGDHAQHVWTQFVLSASLAAGDDPFGPLGLEFGLPLLRFYQPLHYLVSNALSALAGADLRLAHNAVMCVAFSLTPLTFSYFLRKIGLGRWAAAIGALASVTSVAAFGNSFEAYFQMGIATQALGALFFPLFAGSFAGMLRGENRAPTVALFLSLAVVSHVTMALYALLVGGVILAMSPRVGLRGLWRCGAVAALGVALAAFWLFPFLENTERMRPVPDSVAMKDGIGWWHTGVTRAELGDLLGSGRLLDDARRVGRERDEGDKLIDRLNIVPTRRPRPPVITALAALGAAAALIGLRRRGPRTLLFGMALSLALYAGPDDFPFLRLLPFVDRFQVFRSTYFLELFAFGLVGLGAASALRALLRLAATPVRPAVRVPLLALWFSVALAVPAWSAREARDLGALHLDRDAIVDADASAARCPPLPLPGYPFRTVATYEHFIGTEGGCFSAFGMTDHCSHWSGVGASAAQRICSALRAKGDDPALLALTGVRWFAGDGRRAPGNPALRPVDPRALGLGSFGSGRARLFDTGAETFLVALAGRPDPIACTDAEWIERAASWIERYAGRLDAASTPVPMRVEQGALGDLSDFGAAEPVDSDRAAPPPKIRRLERATDTYQSFSFSLESAAPRVFVLPMQAYPGWSARLDGAEIAVHPTGPDMVGVVVPSGSHELSFQWAPSMSDLAFRWLSCLAGILILLAWAAALWRRARGRSRR